MTARRENQAWGPGQFESLDLGNGARIDIQVTKDGRVMLALVGVVSGAQVDITKVSAQLGCGLHEAGARAAQIRTKARREP